MTDFFADWFPIMTRVYGFTPEYQLQMKGATWFHYLGAIPRVMAFEQLRMLQAIHAKNPRDLAQKLEHSLRATPSPTEKGQPSILKQVMPLVGQPALKRFIKVRKKPSG